MHWKVFPAGGTKREQGQCRYHRCVAVVAANMCWLIDNWIAYVEYGTLLFSCMCVARYHHSLDGVVLRQLQNTRPWPGDYAARTLGQCETRWVAKCPIGVPLHVYLHCWQVLRVISLRRESAKCSEGKDQYPMVLLAVGKVQSWYHDKLEAQKYTSLWH